MITLGILALLVAFGIGAAHPKTRHFFLTKKESPKLLTAESSTKLEEWKQVFRETVISVDGEISPEMEEFLRDDGDRLVEVIAAARKKTEESRAKILKEARHEAETITSAWAQSKRPILTGAPYKEFSADWESCLENRERSDVLYRWHKKKFRFGPELRKFILNQCADSSMRNEYRKMFDDQDADK